MSTEWAVLQRVAAIAFMILGWITAGFTNGIQGKPFDPVGAFLSICCMLASIAISVLR